MTATRGYVDVEDVEKAVDALDREIPATAPAAQRAMENLKRVIREWKLHNLDDGK